MRKNIVNMLSFNLAWFFCIYYGNLAAVISLAIFLVIHEVFVGKLRKEWLAISVISVIGIIGDNLVFLTGGIEFTGHLGVPLWLCVTWVMFATTVIHGMAWMNKFHWVWQSALGSIAAPLAYLSGIKLGAASLPYGALAFYPILALVWGMGLPVYFWVARQNFQRPSLFFNQPSLK